MAVNMNPTASAIKPNKAGSLLMRPTQVASVSNVNEPEETLDTITAVAPSVQSQDTQVTEETLAAQETQEEPQVTSQEIPEVTPEVSSSSPYMLKGVNIATDEESQAFMDEEYGDVELADVDESMFDIELDTDSALVREAYETQMEDKKRTVSQRAMYAVDTEVTSDALVEAAEKSDFAVMEQAKEEYASWANVGTRFVAGVIETPRYIAAVPGALAKVIAGDTGEKKRTKEYEVFDRAVNGGLLDWLGLSYEDVVLDPVFQRNGKITLDQRLENDLLSKIKKEKGVTLDEDFLFTQGIKEAAGFTAITGGAFAVRTLTKSGVKASVTDKVGLVASETVKGGVMAASSVVASAKAIEIFHPESAEGKLLVGLAAGTVAPTTLAAANTAVSKVVPYSLTGLAIRGSKVVLKKAPELARNLKHNKSINKLMRTEGMDYATALRTHYERQDAQGGSMGKELAFRLLNDTEMDETTRALAVKSLLKEAVNDPYSREANLVRTANQTFGKDLDALGDAWTQADLLTEAFKRDDFKVTAIDMYQGKYTEEFVNLHKGLNADTIVKDQANMLNFIRDQLQSATDLSELERGELSLAAKTLEKSIQEHMQDVLTLQQQNVAAALDFHTGLKYNPNAPATESLGTLRDTLVEIKKSIKQAMSTGYASIDSQGKHRSHSAYRDINAFLEGMDRSNPAYTQVQKAFNSLTADSVSRVFGETDDTTLVTGVKPNPTQKFSPSALNKTDTLVYVTPEQFTKITGVTVSKEPKSSKTTISHVTSVILNTAEDGAFTVKEALNAKLSAGLGSSSLIPVSLKGTDISPEGILRIKDPTGSIVELNLKKQLSKEGDERHNVALIERSLTDARKKGTLSTEGPFSSLLPNFDSSKVNVSYTELDQFQRGIRRLRREAYYADKYEEHAVYSKLDTMLEESIQSMLKDDVPAYTNRKLLDSMYGDSFIPHYENTQSLVGMATAKNTDRTYKSYISAVVSQAESVPEIRQQLLDVLTPETSAFMKGISSKDATGKLHEILSMTEGRLKSLTAQGKTVASSILDVKLTDVLTSTYKTIGTSADPRAALIANIKALKDSADFQALYTASNGTDTAKMLDTLFSLPDDANLNGVLKDLQDHLDRFDSIMYKDVSAMKDPANTQNVLNLVSNMDKMDEIQASLIVDGNLGKAAPHMIKLVMEDVLKFSDRGLDVSSIDSGLRKYENGLSQLPGGADAIAQLKALKGAQGALNRINASVGKGTTTQATEHNTFVDRMLGLLPSAFSDFRTANKGITSMQFAAVSSAVNVAKSEFRALKKTEHKAAAEILVAALRDKDIYDQVMAFNGKMKDADPTERLRGLSLMFHASNGARLGALEAMITYTDQSLTDEERLQALRSSPEFAEVEQEEAEALATVPELLKRPEEQMEVSNEAIQDQSDRDPLHEVSNHEGVMTDGMSTDEATSAKSKAKFIELKGQGFTKAQVKDIIESLGMADNNNKVLLLKAVDEAYSAG